MRVVSAGVLQHLGRQAEAGDLHVAVFLVLHQLGGGHDADGGGGADDLQVGIVVQQSLGLVSGLLGLVVAVGNFHQLQLGILLVLGQLLHGVDPGVLVGGLGGGGQNGPLALAAGQIVHGVDQRLAHGHGAGLVHEHLTARRVGGGVEGRHLDAGIHRLFQLGLEGVEVVGGDADGIGLLGDQVVQNLDLGVSGGILGIHDVDGGAFAFTGLLEGRGGDLEEGVAGGFADQRDLLAIGGARQRGGHQTGNQQGHEQDRNQFLHGVFLL